MRPLDFYRFGVRLIAAAASEAEHRTAINRIYYGLHHESCCRYFRKTQDHNPLNRNKRHSELRDRFNNATDPVGLAVANSLGKLMRIRAEADYALRVPLRYMNRSYSAEDLAKLAGQVGTNLLADLEEYSAGESTDDCHCPEAYFTG